jgi:hypothetical protein
MRPMNEDAKATAIYDMLKQISVTPPELLSLDDKHMKTRYVFNVLRIFITTNDMQSMYISPNDRRMYVMHSPQSQNARGPDYFDKLVNWLENEDGMEIVAAYLAERDISKFRPKAKPPTTEGKDVILGGWGLPDDAITAALDAIGRPPVFFPHELKAPFDGAEDITKMMKSRRALMHRMKRERYYPLELNPPAEFNGRKRLKLKLALYRDEFLGKPREVQALVQMRGQTLADEIPQIPATIAQHKGF